MWVKLSACVKMLREALRAGNIGRLAVSAMDVPFLLWQVAPHFENEQLKKDGSGPAMTTHIML